MIDFYTHATANGRKPKILLEELDLPYRQIVVDILDGEQFQEDFLLININAKIPAIVDHDGPDRRAHAVFESGAILIYLAEKVGSELWPQNLAARSATLQWLMFQVANTGPMFGQYHHFFSHAPEKIPYAIERYRNEVNRIYDVLDTRLGESEFLAGDCFTIADIANYTWPARFEAPEIDLSIGERKNLRRWFDLLSARPSVQSGMEIPAPPKRSRAFTTDTAQK